MQMSSKLFLTLNYQLNHMDWTEINFFTILLDNENTNDVNWTII